MPRSKITWGITLIPLLLTSVSNVFAFEREIDFARDVAPILEAHCVRCHRPDVRKGDLSLITPADLASAGLLVPGDPGSSYLLDLVMPQGDGARPEMPKEGEPLSPDDVATIRRWIEAGADWPETVTLKEPRGDASWWSLRPIANAAPPQPAAWDANPIDAFIRTKLAEKQLVPSPPADRRTLIRRVTYDLTGLPPTPEDVAAFVADEREDAYERLVDRLLASPHYGEHWGRHWLDVVRFGESNGFERNVLINNVWPFRDYVIRSFNDDKPFDRLVKEHLAGDAIAPKDPNVAIGTAFLVCGPYDNVGNQDADAAAVIRADALDEMVRATSEAFLGLTVGCARCHDHKFDPIAAKDYYSLTATFAGVTHGERDLGQGPWWVGNFNPAPGPFEVFKGGDPKRKGDAVVPASLQVLDSLPAHYSLQQSDEQQRRLALADWIVAADNPLTARVLANRVWQYHFGTGIVDTPSDFGFMGGRPTHPELLDWLARQLLEGDWQLKPLHRLIVTSQTYRQSSVVMDFRLEDLASLAADCALPNPQSAIPNPQSIDADARYLWRFPPRRLSAEEVRDSMLAFGGTLNSRIGGPGFQLYQYVQDNVATYNPLDEVGPETYRRAVYHQNARAARVDVLTDFDCPDPAFAAPRRAVTTTPIQALAMLNHNFPLALAEALAARIERETPTDAAEQVRRSFEIVYGRSPDDTELTASRTLVESHGLRALCRVLINSNEMVTVR
jgi:hypothetical protein